jgi:hypothetical protein
VPEVRAGIQRLPLLACTESGDGMTLPRGCHYEQHLHKPGLVFVVTAAGRVVGQFEVKR